MVLILCSNKRVAIKLNNLMKDFFFKPFQSISAQLHTTFQSAQT